jgi:propionyl-CoA synthetase
MATSLQQEHTESVENPSVYWARAAEECHWYKPYDTVLDDSNKPFYKWFKGGMTNTCFNALDLHVENGLGDQTALIYDSPVTETIQQYTYRELRDEVATFSGVLKENGVETGDRVVIYMPMIPEAAIAMLACARIGAVHSVVFGGFASKSWPPG